MINQNKDKNIHIADPPDTAVQERLQMQSEGQFNAESLATDKPLIMGKSVILHFEVQPIDFDLKNKF
jgi:hypothetical protein